MANKLVREENNDTKVEEESTKYQFILKIRMDGDLEISPNIPPQHLINTLFSVITGVIFASINHSQNNDSRIVKPTQIIQ